MDIYEMCKESAAYIKKQVHKIPETAIVLGSGLGTMAQEIQSAITVPYKQIPYFPVSTAPSHAGEMVFGEELIALSGRTHFYEGYSMQQITYYVRVLKELGVRSLILTNAAGGVNSGYHPGDLMLITDHIKFFDDNPLRGKNLSQFGTRFPDMTYAYSPALQEVARSCAKEQGICLKQGVYAYMPGPNFETPAEIKALQILGADAVGMSTVPEVICARHCGMEVLALSCISNMAAGLTGAVLTEQEVAETGALVHKRFCLLVRRIIERIVQGELD